MGSFQVSRSDISIASLDCPRIHSGTVLSQMVGIENNMIDDLQHELQTHLSAVRRVHIRNTSNGFLESSENRAKLADRLRDQISETRAASKEATSVDAERRGAIRSEEKGRGQEAPESEIEPHYLASAASG